MLEYENENLLNNCFQSRYEHRISIGGEFSKFEEKVFFICLMNTNNNNDFVTMLG